METTQAGPAPANLPRWIWVAGGAVALTIAGIASALALQNVRQAEAPPVEKAAVVAATTAPRAAPKPVAATCAQCGVVESVQAVKLKGEASGVGAVAGGVLGGVVGNQFGKGNGRTAMTVLGAVGGGVAGHEVEKNVKAKTVFNVKLRMDDGTTRTVQQSQAPAVGARVQVEGSTLRAL
ncbi:glycine zipper 2TM domain-containing protein [uncultured Methylibium sp.]|uniref:glycine zipper 2TM domain-containing protein n=1 Tax=uncultured Methylibium sp. TaxID=381093 RepID=UPI0025FCE5E7|nr:glycine zipper 2TM domain-containing protein [uncultured Methylibium sp.]